MTGVVEGLLLLRSLKKTLNRPSKQGWHLAAELNIPKNITLIKLPPYSSELNPMEQVFQQLRKIKLSNTFYKNYEEIDQACVEAWNSFIKVDGNIKN